MAEFDKLRFLQLLQEAPEHKPLLDAPEFSDYLKEQVFDKLKKDGNLDLRTVDFNAIALRDLVPPGYPEMYDRISGGWGQGFNHFFQKTPAASLKQRTFF